MTRAQVAGSSFFAFPGTREESQIERTGPRTQFSAHNITGVAGGGLTSAHNTDPIEIP